MIPRLIILAPFILAIFFGILGFLGQPDAKFVSGSTSSPRLSDSTK